MHLMSSIAAFSRPDLNTLRQPMFGEHSSSSGIDTSPSKQISATPITPITPNSFNFLEVLAFLYPEQTDRINPGKDIHTIQSEITMRLFGAPSFNDDSLTKAARVIRKHFPDFAKALQDANFADVDNRTTLISHLQSQFPEFVLQPVDPYTLEIKTDPKTTCRFSAFA